MTEIGTNIDKVARSYQQAFSQLKEGKGNLISKAEKLRTLGIKAKKELPSGLQSCSEEDTENELEN